MKQTSIAISQRGTLSPADPKITFKIQVVFSPSFSRESPVFLVFRLRIPNKNKSLTTILTHSPSPIIVVIPVINLNSNPKALTILNHDLQFHNPQSTLLWSDSQVYFTIRQCWCWHADSESISLPLLPYYSQWKQNQMLERFILKSHKNVCTPLFSSTHSSDSLHRYIE